MLGNLWKMLQAVVFTLILVAFFFALPIIIGAIVVGLLVGIIYLSLKEGGDLTKPPE